MEFSPTSPSGSVAGTGAVINGVVTGGASASTAPAGTFGTMDSRGLTVTVLGTGISSTVSQGGQFTLTGVPAGNVQLKFAGSGVDALVTIAGITASDRIDITVTVNGGSARVESEHRRRDNNRVEVAGRVTARDATARTLRVRDTLVTVPATAVIRHGSRALTFADIQVGDMVEVKGTVENAGVTATEVKVEDRDDDEGEDDDDDLSELQGVVTGLGGTCPAVTFTVGATRVSTSSATTFKDVACERVRNDMRVEVKGRRQADGSLAATRVEVEH